VLGTLHGGGVLAYCRQQCEARVRSNRALRRRVPRQTLLHYRYCAALLHAAAAPALTPTALPPPSLPRQSGDPDVLTDWPAALHLLGHIYNNNL